MNRWTTKTRVRATVALALASALAEAAMSCAATPAAAETVTVTATKPVGDKPVQKASKQETAGVITGFAVGAAAGGPIGAIFGAAAGAWLGDRYHRQDEERHLLAANLDASESRQAALGLEMQRVNASLADSESRRARYGSTVETSHDLEVTVTFRTGEAALREDSVEALRKLGALLTTVPDAQARIAGYADARGPERLNLELSRQRAFAVAAVLEAAGVDRERLVVEAHGKSFAIADPTDVDGNAFERRVTVDIERALPSLARAE